MMHKQTQGRAMKQGDTVQYGHKASAKPHVYTFGYKKQDNQPMTSYNEY